MRIIGCDLHARQQTVAMLDTTTGEIVNMTLTHEGNNVRELSDLGYSPVATEIIRLLCSSITVTSCSCV